MTHDTFWMIFNIIFLFVAAKALIIGSDFSFPKWFKYGKQYTKWYFNRPVFKPVPKVDLKIQYCSLCKEEPTRVCPQCGKLHCKYCPCHMFEG